MELKIGTQHFLLQGQKALYWQEQKMLIVGDVHLGKVSHFRKNGIFLPEQIVAQDIARLQTLMDAFKPKTFCVLGDLFHSDYNKEWNNFKAFREDNKQVDFLLVQGNHDTLHPSFYAQLPMQVVTTFESEGILLVHETIEGNSSFQITAHVHPAFLMVGRAKQRLRLACFYKKEKELIIPAFGKFTGMHTIKKKKNEQVFAIAEDQLIAL